MFFNVLGPWDCFPKRLKQKIQNIFRQKQEKRTAKAICFIASPPPPVWRTHKLWREHVRLVWSERAGPFPTISFQVLIIFKLCITYYIEELQWKCWLISVSFLHYTKKNEGYDSNFLEFFPFFIIFYLCIWSSGNVQQLMCLWVFLWVVQNRQKKKKKTNSQALIRGDTQWCFWS